MNRSWWGRWIGLLMVALAVGGLGSAALAATDPAGNPRRVALVVGNSAYPESPLRNPGNDARAMSELLSRAGFRVELRTDTSRAELLQAITRFGQKLRDPQIQFAVFYYAGHGFQQDWRNFLVPVDARVQTATDVPRQTVDVGELVRQMAEGQARGRSFLVILDACRDDPFAGSYRPPAKGLVPFDAPVGSLLAYATAPGRVAIDGSEGGNGLYTKHLLRELAVPEASVEDAFKRVRLNVRVESKGRQIPWELASLEERLFLFPSARTTLSESELQRRFDEELAAWTRVRQTANPAALVEFLRAYPSGNASELAQARLNRLLAEEVRRAAEAERVAAAAAALEPSPAPRPAAATRTAPPAAVPAPAPVPPPVPMPAPAPVSVAPAPPPPPPPPPVPVPAPVPPTPAAPTPTPSATPAPPPPGTPSPLPSPLPSPEPVLLASAGTVPPTPYFSGQVEHWRDYRVGQRLEYRLINRFVGSEQPITRRVTAVDVAADRVELDDGQFVSDLMGNTVSNQVGAMDTPRQFYPAEFVIGKRWQTEFRQRRPSGTVYTFRYKVRVAAKETVQVPAGRFEAWRIEAEGFNVELGAHIRRTLWVTPGVPADIIAETQVRLRSGTVEQYDRQELVAVRNP